MKELIIEILNKLEKSNYIDTAEHLYDAIRNIKSHIDDENLYLYTNDLLLSLTSCTVIDNDGVIKECILLLRKN